MDFFDGAGTRGFGAKPHPWFMTHTHTHTHMQAALPVREANVSEAALLSHSVIQSCSNAVIQSFSSFPTCSLRAEKIPPRFAASENGEDGSASCGPSSGRPCYGRTSRAARPRAHESDDPNGQEQSRYTNAE